MNSEEVKRNIWNNTVSNYVCVGLRIVVGLLMFRMLFQELSKEEFGFWALLWSVFGYGILLDFGFGFTAQKRVAELSVHRNWEELSRVLSTIFFSYLAIGAAIIAGGTLLAPWFIDLFEIAPGNREYFLRLLICFFWGLGLAFPLGVFPEMLRGLQRISTANSILVAGMTLNFVLAAVALHFDYGLMTLLVLALVCTFLPDLVCGVVAFRHLRGVRIRLGLFSRGMVRETMSFSLFAYVTTISNLILTKTDHLIISTTLAVSAVAIYQAGAKIAEVFYSFTQQLPDTLSPAAAHLHTQGDRTTLRQLLVSATRINVMIATPLYLLVALFMKPIVRLLTGMEDPGRETLYVAHILLLWFYFMVVTQGVTKRIFMMCGHHRRLMVLSVGEALLNLGLSIGLVVAFQNVICVALGSLISTFIFGWFYIWPWAAREANMTSLALARAVFVRAALACLPLVAIMSLDRWVPGLSASPSSALLALKCVVAIATAAVGVWVLGLNEGERARLIAFALRRFQRERAA